MTEDKMARKNAQGRLEGWPVVTQGITDDTWCRAVRSPKLGSTKRRKTQWKRLPKIVSDNLGYFS
jgi:hypothetical protein